MLASQGYATSGPKDSLKPFSFKRRSPGPHDVHFAVHFCGICHSDIHQARDEWGGSQFPMVPGHEVVGKVVAVGASVKRFAVGDLVGVGCMVDSCRSCESCKDGLEQYCENGMVGTYNATERDGSPTYGGYSNQMVVDEKYVLRLPKNLPLDGTAPLLCAGITTYSPLRHWKAGPGKKVGVVGLGGLGHMAVKLARAMGAEVTVLSQSPQKKDDALKMGAHHFVVTKDKKQLDGAKNSLDLIINTVSAPTDWNGTLQLLRRDGAMVLLGVSPDAVSLHASSLIMTRKTLCGSLIGGIAETQEMLDFCGKHNITCDVERIEAAKINEAYERVMRSDVRYRFVIDVQASPELSAAP